MSFDVRGMPELVWECRKAMANALRREAATETSAYMRDRLNGIAAQFETGQ